MSFDVRRRQSTGEDMGGHFDTYRGVVLDTADPLANDRVLVEVPDVLAAESMWARPEQPGAARPATGEFCGEHPGGRQPLTAIESSGPDRVA
jgi:hypothetical protein